MHYPGSLQLIYSSSYHLLLMWCAKKEKACHGVNFLNSLICFIRLLQFLTSNLSVLSNDSLSLHCAALCPNRAVSLVDSQLVTRRENFVTFISGKKYHHLLQTQTHRNRFYQHFYKLGIDGKEEEKRTSEGVEQVSQFIKSLWLVNNKIILYNLNVII